MLLNDIGKSPDSTLKKINQYLNYNYGFKIAEDASDRDLVVIKEQIEEEIVDLKIKGEDARVSPEISKRLLVLEGIKTLREFAIVSFQSPDFDKVINGMSKFVADDFRISGAQDSDFEESVRDAMKHYRSSKYRFPDNVVEQRVRECARGLLMNSTQVMGEDTPEEEADLDAEFSGLDEADPFGNVGKRASAIGGHAADVPDTPQARHALKALHNPGLSIAPQADDQVPMIRDKNGRMVPDPFAAQSAARRKGIVMKENLVKSLRLLLETEVSQAEVMMAAKGFAQELQEMIEKIGRLQNEDLPPVTDQMRETYGTENSSAFQTQIYGALQGVMDSLYTAKNQVDDAVSSLATTGQVGAQIDMDKDINVDVNMDPTAMDADVGADLDLDNIAADLDSEEMDDEFGGEEPLGREKKDESVKLQKKVLEMKKLIAKAKKLKEAKKHA